MWACGDSWSDSIRASAAQNPSDAVAQTSRSFFPGGSAGRVHNRIQRATTFLERRCKAETPATAMQRVMARSLGRESGDQGMPKTVSDDSSRGHEKGDRGLSFQF